MTFDTATTYKIAVSRYALTGKIPPGDPFWRDFNASFENRELEPFDLGRMIWDGHPFTTWHDKQWRHSANYLAGQHIGLDFDSGDSAIHQLVADHFISKHASIVYTTPSHTPEKPRARVVFLLDTPIQRATNYALAAQAMLWLYGTADRQCKDAARFFYGSKGCDMELLNGILPITKLRKLIQQYIETGKRERAKHQTSAPANATGYVTAALRNEVDAVRAAPNGTRNHTLNKAAWNLARFVSTGELSAIVIEDALTDAAIDAGLHEQEITPTLRSAFRATGIQ